MGARILLGGFILLVGNGSPASGQAIAPTRATIACGGVEIQTLTPQAAFPELEFGAQVFLTGNQLLVTAPEWSETQLGAIQVFDRTPDGFVFRKRLAPLSPSPDDPYFARDVAVTGDLLFATGFDGTDTLVHVFERDLGGPGEWGLSTVVPGFGWIDADGDVLAVGEYSSIVLRERHCGGPNAWGVTATFAPSPPTPLYFVGSEVAIDGATVAAAATPDFFHTLTWNCLTYERDLGGPGTWGNAAVLGGPFGAYSPSFQVSVELEGDLLLWGTTQATWLHARDAGGSSAWGLVQTLLTCPDPGCRESFEPWGRRLRGGRAVLAGTVYDSFSELERRLTVYQVGRDSAGLPRLARTHVVHAGLPAGSSYAWGRGLDLAGRLVVVGDPVASAVHVYRLDTPCPAQAAPGAVPR